MSNKNCKVLVIGAGPGGYVCAIRAAQLGLDTIIVDSQAPGGTCLNVGCIPSKALIHAADEFYNITHANHGPLGITTGTPSIDFGQTIGWKDDVVKRLTGGVSLLLKKAGAQLMIGSARFVDGKTVIVETSEGDITVNADNVVIATGSEPVSLPSLPFGGDVMSSTEALALTEIPSRLAVVGGGYIGLEIGTAYAKLGSEVTIVEAAQSLLPQYDTALTKPVLARLETLGISVKTSTFAEGFSEGVLRTSNGDISADKVLVTVGRKPRTELASELSLTMNGTFIDINKHCQTSMRGTYAIGDITGEPMLAHRAMAQGELVAEHIAGHKVQWDKQCIPAVCFTDPEIVCCGAQPGDIEGTKVSEFPFAANGRAMTCEREDGFVRVVWREADHAVLGIQAVGANISELSASFALAIEMGACLEDIAATIHSHPTQSEALQEAAARALGKALHI